MGVFSVKVKDVDTSLGGSGGRVLSVRTSSSSSFKTPVRPICTDEITAKNFLGYRGEISAPMAALPLNINGDSRIKRFSSDSNFVKELGRTLQSLSDSTWFVPSFPILQTSSSLIPGRNNLHKIAFELQAEVSGINFVCMPLISGNPFEFREAVLDWTNSAEERGYGCVVQLDMKDDVASLSSRLDYLAELTETGLISVINLKYANPESHHAQYAEVWSKRESLKALINCSEVPRHGGNKDILPEIQTKLISYGIDSFSRKKWVVHPKAVAHFNLQPPPKKLDDIQNYHMAVHSASVRVRHNCYRKIEDEYRCNCTICLGNSISELAERFAYKDNGEIENMGMAYFSRIHDHQSNQSEMARAMKFIQSQEMNDYEVLQTEERRNIERLISL